MATGVEVAQIASSVFAGCGLFVAAYQAYRARVVAEQSQRAADLQALLRFFDGVLERETTLHSTREDAVEQRRAFIELLTFLEVYASAHNKNLFGTGCEQMLRLKLEDSAIELGAAEAWHSLIEEAGDRSTTFAELAAFMARHRAEIEDRKAERARKASRAAS